MFWQRLRLALLTSVVLAAAPGAVWADDADDEDKADDKKAEKVEAPAPADHHGNGCGNGTRKVLVNEWVPEWYETCRTVYKQVQVQEKYTYYKTVCVPEQRVVTVHRMVPECVEEERCVCRMVPCVETRTVCKPVWTCKQVTVMKRRCVDRGHWECCEVPCGPSLRDRLCRKNSCCDPCNPCCEPCPRTKTVRRWVPCKVWEEYPCTKTVRCCEMVQTTCQVTVCKPVYEKVRVKVTRCRCVCEQKTCCVMVKKCVPCEGVRCVCKCVPCQEKVRCCRMVCRQVEREVTDCCAAPCCETSCGACCGGGFRFFRNKGCGTSCGGCASSCGTGCCH